MRQPIETAPKDGRDIWVEDDRAAYDVAHWSSETKQWVWKNGGAIRITPTHWTPIPEPQYQEGEQLGSPLQVVRVRRWSTASLIAAALVVAALIGVYFGTEMVAFATRYADLLDVDDIGTVGGQKSLGTGLVRAPDADLREAAGASQSSGRREATEVRMQDAEATRHAVPTSTAQFRQALEQETLLSDTLAGELAATRSELDTRVALADKAVDEAAQLRRAAEVTTAELRKSLQQEHERSAALANELAKARIDLEATVALPSKSHDEVLQGSQAAEDAEKMRNSLQQERAHAAALASELAGNRREIETLAAQSQKAFDEAVQQKQTAEAATAQLREALQQEQQKTAALMQEAKAAQAMTTAADPERRGLEDAQAHAAALASELAGTRREIESQAAQLQEVVDEAVQQKQTAEAATTQLRGALQQEQQKTAALTQEAKAAQAETASRDRDPGRAIAKGYRCGYETEAGGRDRHRGTATIPAAGAKEDRHPDAGSQGRASDDDESPSQSGAHSKRRRRVPQPSRASLRGMRREIETQAAQSQKAVDAATKQKQAAETAIAELRAIPAAGAKENCRPDAGSQGRASGDASRDREPGRAIAKGYRRGYETEAGGGDAPSRNCDDALQQEQKKTATLTQEAKAAQATTTAAEPERRALEDAQARAAALASELAGTRREIETQAAQSQKAVDEAVQQKQTAEAATAELREALQQEQKKTAALTQEAKAAQAGTRREIETQAAQSQKAIDAVMKQKQAAETAIAELRRSLQQEQKKTAALTQEAKAAQAGRAARSRPRPRNRRRPSMRLRNRSRRQRPPPRNCDDPCNRSKRRLLP